ncbi:histidine--tRNA ligase [Candidatus Daviesbacteria bacterium RIFCSPLOWO2_01_FULL_43_38]|uniref:Histidine--tRNA ligase n=2 Tax=Candidatus Daviesiibacteriota TaxID=1752718 RepID=A0A1F5K2M2_9BACT|nr:MAG: histidine--tRNA ligase [Candidatus Daviesbacteria bacterium RIFCSPHIGHO2_01_FULL_43_17]OGE35085.1 MAG: histidine--tRNA ligase [Candidatus Daviesbacteria bacterium RIFCSPHIGHO2_12_FULL_43_11]OGE63349.1 MAG: histidine--tRNA ligase [Candidatus Daviesbacteria bacterium RIFCSPLOWO2_01_FULL_43_38]
MGQINTSTPKGFRDFLPEQANARQFVVGKIIETFRLFGFEPLETPALEFAETLNGKYGEEEKLIYEFETKGGDKVALRYDQTVPLARVAAQYPDLPKPFKRYQIQPVWRGENPQKGRFREFLQCDIDNVGSSSPLSDAEIIACALSVAKNLGFQSSFMEINDRTNFGNLESKYVSAIDKLKKIGEDGVIEELVSKGLPKNDATMILDSIRVKQPNENLRQIFQFLEQMGFKEGEDFKFSPTLARGLDYYTSTVFELVTPESNNSLAGGGRFDKLIGRYSGVDTPAVGISFGFDRIVEVMSELQLLPKLSSSAKVLVTVFSPDLLDKSLEIGSLLRSGNINTEVWLDPESKLDKQLKYADQKGIPYVLIIGPEEAEKGTVTLKNLTDKTQKTFPLDELASKLSS